MVISLDQENFKKEVLEETLPALVDFYADWCPPCQALHPIFEEVAKKYQGKIKFGRLNIGQAQETAEEFNVMSVPTLLFFKNGKEIKRITGLISQDALEKNLTLF